MKCSAHNASNHCSIPLLLLRGSENAQLTKPRHGRGDDRRIDLTFGNAGPRNMLPEVACCGIQFLGLCRAVSVASARAKVSLFSGCIQQCPALLQGFQEKPHGCVHREPSIYIWQTARPLKAHECRAFALGLLQFFTRLCVPCGPT